MESDDLDLLLSILLMLHVEGLMLFMSMDFIHGILQREFFLFSEAGGKVSDFSGIEKNLTGEEFIAANNIVFPEFLEIVSKFMKI